MRSNVTLVIVAVIVVAAAAGAYFILNDGSGIGVDTVKEKIKAKDYVEHDTDIVVTAEDKQTHAPASELLDILYLWAGGEVKYTTTIDYKGKRIECNVYTMNRDGLSITTVNDPVTNIAYQTFETKQSQIIGRTLVDTNLPTNKVQSEQTVTEGTYVKWNASIPYDGQDNIMLKGIEEHRFVSFDASTSTGDLLITNDMKLNEPIRLEIQSVGPDGSYVYKGSSVVHSKTDFLSNIDFENELAYLKEKGYTVERGDQVQKTIDTAFGKRNVTVETLSCTNGTDKKVYEYTYGETGVIYSILCKRDDAGIHMEGTVKLKATSLFK